MEDYGKEVYVEPRYKHTVPYKNLSFRPIAVLPGVFPVDPLRDLLDRAHCVKRDEHRAVSLTTYALDGEEFGMHKDVLLPLMQEFFKDIPCSEYSVLPFQSALMHQDKDWEDKLFLSIAAVDSRLSVSAAHPLDDMPSSIHIVTGQVFVLDPSTWHSAANSVRGNHLNVLLQCCVDKSWVLLNRPELLRPILREPGEIAMEIERLQKLTQFDGEIPLFPNAAEL